MILGACSQGKGQQDGNEEPHGLTVDGGMGSSLKIEVMDPDLAVPQELYDSEISFGVSCVWDNGFDIVLGCEPNFTKTGHTETYIGACRWLKEAACRHYPGSVFARRHGHGIRLVRAKDETET